jgi:hypothetical protein
MSSSPFILPEGLSLALGGNSLVIRHAGDVILEQSLGRKLSRVEAGGDLTLRFGPITGVLRAEGTMTIDGDVDAQELRADEIVLGAYEVRARAIVARRRVTVGRAVLDVDVIVAPEVHIDPEATGRVRIVDCTNERPPLRVRGCLSLEEFEQDFGGAGEFLARRGVIPINPLPAGSETGDGEDDSTETDDDHARSHESQRARSARGLRLLTPGSAARAAPEPVRPADRPTDRGADRSAATWGPRGGERAVDRGGDRAGPASHADDASARFVDRATERIIERGADRGPPRGVDRDAPSLDRPRPAAAPSGGAESFRHADAPRPSPRLGDATPRPPEGRQPEREALSALRDGPGDRYERMPASPRTEASSPSPRSDDRPTGSPAQDAASSQGNGRPPYPAAAPTAARPGASAAPAGAQPPSTPAPTATPTPAAGAAAPTPGRRRIRKDIGRQEARLRRLAARIAAAYPTDAPPPIAEVTRLANSGGMVELAERLDELWVATLKHHAIARSQPPRSALTSFQSMNVLTLD